MRRGFGLLALIAVLGAAAFVVVLAYHSLSRGSARTLFSIQERRELDALARSALEEAAFVVQSALEQGNPAWENWCRTPLDVAVRTITPEKAREIAQNMTLDPSALAYSAGPVTVARRAPIRDARPGRPPEMGVIELQVVVEVRRDAPRHAAQLKVTEWRWMRMADDLGPFAFAGKHVEVSSEPVGRRLENP